MSGKEVNDEQQKNIPLISVALFVFHLDISGKVINDEQPAKIPLKSVTLFVFHLDISGNEFKEEHLQKIDEILDYKIVKYS